MRKLKAISKKMIFPAAVLFAVVIVAAVSRGLSIRKAEGSGGIQVPGATVMQYVLMELKQLFKFSRY